MIEDNQDSANSLKTLLEVCGYVVTVAYTARDGLECAKEFEPHVILCDIGLPDTDGFALAPLLRREPGLADTHLIAVTAYGANLDFARSKKAGFDEHLVKPVAPAVLLERLDALLQQAQSRGERESGAT